MLETTTSKASRILGVGLLLLITARWAGWDSPWFAVGCFALLVAAFVIGGYKRRHKDTDEPTGLNLHR